MRKSRLQKGLLALVVVVLVFSAAPYFFPVTTATPERTVPFPESAYTKIDGVFLHYRIWETDPNGFKGKVLLVHGLGGSTFSWRNNVDALTRSGYLVLAVDLPGFGYSDRKKGMDHSQESRSDLLWKLLGQVDASLEPGMGADSWNLVGHSMGAGTVTAMALADPLRTRSIVYVDGAVLTGGNSLGFLAGYPPVGRWIEVLGRKLFLKRDKIVDFLTSAYGSAPSDSEVDGYLAPLLLDGTEGSFTDMMRTSTRISESDFKDLTVPVAAIWGGQDTWVPVEEGEKLKALLPAMKLVVIPDAGHCAMETHSVLFNSYLVEALDKASK